MTFELKRLPAIVHIDDADCDDCKRKMGDGETLFPVVKVTKIIEFVYNEYSPLYGPRENSGGKNVERRHLAESHVCKECYLKRLGLGSRVEALEQDVTALNSVTHRRHSRL